MRNDQKILLNYKDLRDFLEHLTELGQVLKIDDAEPEIEIGAISDILATGQEHPALLFDKVKGYPSGYRLFVNSINTPFRTALALGIDTAQDITGYTKAWKQRLKNFHPISPKEVTDGPVTENVVTGDDVNLLVFPTPKWHEHDGGKYIGTGCSVITRGPEDGWANVGTYRAQIHDRRTLGLYVSPGKHAKLIMEKYWAAGKSCPVAISFGPDPALFIASHSAVPYGMSEYDYAGWIKGEPLEVMRAPLSGLPIPARSEIVVEGEIPPFQVEKRTEGPFGEYTGYYAGAARLEPVVKVQSIMFRNDPILLGAPPLRPPNTNGGHSFTRAAALWEGIEKCGVPEIKGVGFPINNGSMLMVISVKQRFHGHPRQALGGAIGVRTGADFQRIVVVVDDDIDPWNISEVMWAICTRCDLENQIDLIRGRTSSALDPILSPEKRATFDYTSATLLVDACKPFRWIDQFPRSNNVSPDLRSKIMSKWGEVSRLGRAGQIIRDKQ